MGKVNKIVNYIKKGTAVILAVATFAGVFAPGVAYATAEAPLNELEELLIEENVELEYFEISLEEVSIEVSSENAYGAKITAAVEFVPGSSYVIVTASEYNFAGVAEEREFAIDLSEMEDFAGADGEALEFVIEDLETGEIFEYDLDMGVLSSTDLFGGLITLLGGALLLGLDLFNRMLQIGEITVMEGMIWLTLTAGLIACVPILGMLFGPCQLGGQGFQAMNSNFTHFDVMHHGGEVFIGEGMSLQEAAVRIRNGQNVWAATAADARSAAQLATNRLPSLVQNNANTGSRANMYLDHILPMPRTGGRAYFGTNFRRGWW